MGTHPIFESDFDCLTEMITEEEIKREGDRIIAEFGEYADEFTLKDSFYHGKFGRCLRFYIKTLENEEYRVLFHRHGVSCLTNSTQFESFEQFFNTFSPAYRDLFTQNLHDKLQELVILSVPTCSAFRSFLPLGHT